MANRQVVSINVADPHAVKEKLLNGNGVHDDDDDKFDDFDDIHTRSSASSSSSSSSSSSNHLSSPNPSPDDSNHNHKKGDSGKRKDGRVMKDEPSSRDRLPKQGALTFGRLMQQAKPERRLLVVATFFLFIGSVLNMAVPAFVGSIIDIISSSSSSEVDFTQSSSWLTAMLARISGIHNDSTKMLTVLVFCLVVLIVAGAFASCFRGWLFNLAGERVVARIRKQLFSTVIQNEISFFDVTRTGELVNRLASDTTTLKDAATINLSMGLRECATVAFGIAYLLFTSPKLTGVMLSVVPLVAISAVVYGRKIRALSKSIQEKLARATEIADESFSQIRTVRAFYLEPKQVRDYSAGVEETYKLGARMAMLYGVFIGFIGIFAGGSMILVMWYGSTLVLNGELTTGVLTSFVLYTLTVGISLGGMASLYSSFMQALGASERVFELLDRSSLIPIDGVGSRPKAIRGHVSFDNVSFNYPARRDVMVLKNVSIELQPGTVTALVGPSGSGKSTCVALIERFYDLATPIGSSSDSSPSASSNHASYSDHLPLLPRPSTPSSSNSRITPTSTNPSVTVVNDSSSSTGEKEGECHTGRILIDGIDIRAVDPSWLHRHVALVSQEPVLFACSIRDNLTLGRADLYTDEQIVEASTMANAHEFVNEFPDKYDTMVGERGIRLSGGQRQRIAIARALLMNPTILIADEATSALDAESEYHVQLALDRLMSGRTTLVIAHRLSTVKNANSVVVMQHGQVVEVGTHQQLLDKGGLYTKLVKRQLHNAPLAPPSGSPSSATRGN